MKLFKRPNSPYWWYQFTVSGKRYRGSTKHLLKDKTGANAFVVQEYQVMLGQGLHGTKQPITLSAAFEHTFSEVSGQTERLYRSAYKTLAQHFGAHRNIHEITEAQIDTFAQRLRKEGKKDNTIKGYLKALIRTNKAVAKTYRTNADLSIPKGLKTFVKTRYLSEIEEQGVLDLLWTGPTVTDRKSHDLAVVLLDTGMRLMEGVNLSWADINMTRRDIEVYRTKTRTLSVVPISNRAYEVLQRNHNQKAPFESMEFAIKHLRKVIHEVCNTNQTVVEQRGTATIHSLRDTFASRLVQRGMHLNELAKLLGHSTTAMTEKYAQLEQTGVVEKARRLMNG